MHKKRGFDLGKLSKKYLLKLYVVDNNDYLNLVQQMGSFYIDPSPLMEKIRKKPSALETLVAQIALTFGLTGRHAYGPFF